MGLGSFISGVLVPMTLSLIPGWGHIWLHRKQIGLLLFMLFLASINMALVFDLLWEWEFSTWLIRIAWATAISTWVFSVFDTFRGAIWSKTAGVRRRRRRYLRRTVRHYLRDEHGQAEEAATRMLRMNPTDATALVYLAMIQSGDGRRKEAMRTLSRAQAVDVADHWKNEIDAEIARLKNYRKV